MFDWLLNPIIYVLTAALWVIFVTIPFVFLKYIALGLETIAVTLPKFLLFGGSEISLNHLPFMFLRFSIIAIALFFLLWICVFVRYLFQDAESALQSAKTATKYSFMCWIYIFLIPLGIFALYWIVEWMLALINITQETANGGIANMLFLAVRPESIDYNVWTNIANNNFWFRFNDFIQLGGSSNFFFICFNMILAFILSIGVLASYFYAGVTIVIKIFDQVFLFCISPGIATTSILDGGKRMSQWKDMMVSKSFIVFGIVLASRIYISLVSFAIKNISLITGINSNSFWAQFPNYITILLITTGGALAFAEFGNVMAVFLGEGVGLKESMHQTHSLINSASKFKQKTKSNWKKLKSKTFKRKAKNETIVPKTLPKKQN